MRSTTANMLSGTRSIRLLRTGFMLLAALVVSFSALHAKAAELPVTGGPKELLIAYQTKPADRPAFRAYLLGEGAQKLAAWQAAGVIGGYQIVFNPFATPGTWDAMTIVSFKDYRDTARWRELERTSPGGLTPAGQQLVTDIDTYSADLSWEGTAKDASPEGKRALYVIPYEFGAADQYRAYVNGYVIPQVEGWMREGVLSRYRIYMNRYPVGRPWDALFIYEYRDLENFGRRDETVAKVRAPLRDNPEWKRLNDTKSQIRSETENTQAEILVSH